MIVAIAIFFFLIIMFNLITNKFQWRKLWRDVHEDEDDDDDYDDDGDDGHVGDEDDDDDDDDNDKCDHYDYDDYDDDGRKFYVKDFMIF